MFWKYWRYGLSIRISLLWIKKWIFTVLKFLKSSNDIYLCTIQVMVNFEKPANQSDAEKIYRNSISQQYYNIFVGVYANIWNYFISYNISQYGVAALMGNLYDESKMESGVYNIDFHNIIGLTDDEYVNNVNNEIYNIL